MKATLEFNLPEEREEYETFMNAHKYHNALWEFSNFLRNRYKHTDFPSKAAQKEFEEIREGFWEKLRDAEVEDV